MFSFFANPARFMGLSKVLAPLLGAVAVACLGVGLWLAVQAPDDYQQGASVKIMFVHVPAAWMGLFCYLCLAGASFFGLVFRHLLADAAAKAAAPLGAAFTALALITGSLWGRPMWGTWWAWGDARLTSEFILFVFYLGYMALQMALDDEAKAARASAILALVGLVNLPVVHFSVEWWNSLHQGSTILSVEGIADPKIAKPMLWPLLCSLGGTAQAAGAVAKAQARPLVRHQLAAVRR